MAAVTAGVVGSLAAGALAAKGSKDAGAAAAAGANNATAEQRRQFDLVNQQQAPWREAGQRGLTALEQLLGTSGQGPANYDQFTNSPGYQFQLQQGTQAAERSAAARGLLGSGNTLAALNEYGQGLAGTTFNQHLNQLQGLAGIGQGATNATSNAAMQTGANVSNNMMQAGNARASGIQGQYAGINNALQGSLNNFAGAWASRAPSLQQFGSGQAANNAWGATNFQLPGLQ